MPHAGGRPRIFNSVEEIEKCFEKYKAYLKEENSVPTMAGLAYFLGVDRHTIYNYSQRDEFFPTIKIYRDWVLMKIEENCAIKGHGGSIFLAKNYGYTDHREINNTSTSEVVIVNDTEQVNEILEEEKELEDLDIEYTN